MRKSLSCLLFFGLLASCSTDFTLEADWRDIPVVYGFLNIADTAHYVRVERAFLEEGGDASQIAQIADSIYYADGALRVVLERQRGNNMVEFELERVDGNREGYPREEGTFANDPNYLWKISAEEADLRGGDLVRINLIRDISVGNGSQEPVFAETIILSELSPRQSVPQNDLGLDDYTLQQSIRWTAGDEAKIFNISFVMEVEERPMDGGPTSIQTVKWEVGKNFRPDDNFLSIPFNGAGFYQALAGSLIEDPNLQRDLLSVSIEYAGAGQEIVDYLQISNANIGITSSQNIPVYTNVENGLGVFSSRNVVYRRDFSLTGRSRDSLRNGVFTRNLNFR